MPHFEVLSAQAHGHIRVDEPQLVGEFARRHMLNIELREAIQAASEFPLFISKVSNTNSWAISALCGLAPGENVFCQQHQWLAHYTPLCLKTLPLLIQMNDQGSQTLLDTQSVAISEDKGEALYLSTGRPSAYLNAKQKLLAERVAAMSQTTELLNQLAELDLFQPVDLIIEFADNTQQRVGGLYSLNEQRIQELSPAQLASLNKHNTLSVLFNILGSIFQVNRLIRLHNSRFTERAVSNIKFETSKL